MQDFVQWAIYCALAFVCLSCLCAPLQYVFVTSFQVVSNTDDIARVTKKGGLVWPSPGLIPTYRGFLDEDYFLASPQIMRRKAAAAPPLPGQMFVSSDIILPLKRLLAKIQKSNLANDWAEMRQNDMIRL
ncbi:hypothetical protein FISHEDRAFT_61344 [Fistulina hepatica ATCC 64428]|uniref:Uncharacterized protein n=1 Tax=Fistulina hepatica ATCC 64428 TaxID=1128425 RepID=A0A0D7A2Y1_9AGAR|nr:hypothetical protein FISHEDRAFT_61344 [Fistulina hepatica ATCC 64428]